MKENNNLKELMAEFCNIVMPGHGKAKGYINVKKKVADLGVDARTYYHWKNASAFPRLPDFVKRVNSKGFKLIIIPNYEDM